MPMSRVLDTSETPTVERLPASGGRVVVGRDAAGVFAQPLTPMLTAVAVTVLIVAAIQFARSAGLVAALWGANAVAIAVWLRSGRGVTFDLCFGGLMTLAILGGQFLAGNGPRHSAMFTVANMIEIVAAVLLVRRFAPTLNLASVEGVSRFLMAGAVVAPLPAALFAAIMLSVMDGAPMLATFQTWWFGHALGIAVLSSLGLALTRRDVGLLRKPWRLLEAVSLLGLLTAVCVLVFWVVKVQVGFIVIPLLILIAARFRVLGLTTALALVAVTAVSGAMLGVGPTDSTGMDRSQRALLAQMMVLFGCLPLLLVAALLEERDRLAERSRVGRARAERASEAKSRLLANVAHEIKSPVGGVIGIGDLWRTGQLGPVNETQVEMAEMLVKTARQVETLAHDLLDVARAESGAVKVELRPTDVPGVLEDVRRAIALRPEAGGLRLEVVCEGDGLIALADSQRLTQVVANLGTNAIKYGASGGIVIFRAHRIYDGVRIQVIDRGPGLSSEKQAQLFEPFNRLGLERSTVEGHGIGLALAKRLVELQGGSIGVVSTPGQGAAFHVDLPLA